MCCFFFSILVSFLVVDVIIISESRKAVSFQEVTDTSFNDSILILLLKHVLISEVIQKQLSLNGLLEMNTQFWSIRNDSNESLKDFFFSLFFSFFFFLFIFSVSLGRILCSHTSYVIENIIFAARVQIQWLSQQWGRI